MGFIMKTNAQKTKFSESLRGLMIQFGYSQAFLAKSIGVSQRAISKWLNNQSEPTATNIYNVAKFFEVTADFLLGLSVV